MPKRTQNVASGFTSSHSLVGDLKLTLIRDSARTPWSLTYRKLENQLNTTILAWNQLRNEIWYDEKVRRRFSENEEKPL